MLEKAGSLCLNVESRGQTLEVTDAELVRQARRGDANAFASLIARHERSMLALAYAGTRCSATAADVVQDSVVRCWKKLGDLREESKFASWLATTVRHLATNAVRSPARRFKLVGHEALDQHAVGDSTQSVGDADDADQLRRAISSLDPISASIVTLKYYENLPSKQIAELLDLTPAAVDMRLTRARSELRVQLSQTDLAPPAAQATVTEYQ
jgi:RNA polymerase sigma-70 factor (ECF subfamily)